jgi:mannan endo-1,4-beta-mannosidase
MRYRLLLLVSVVVACVSLSLTGVHLKFRYLTPAPPSRLPHSPTGYLGVYERGVPPSYAPIETFARTIGEQPNLVGYYSGWAEKFPSSFAQTLHNHHQIPYVQIDPTYATVSQIAAGAYDQYLETYAESVREFGHAVVIGFGHEMNAPWYTWGYKHKDVPPATFVAAWQHIVTLFRAEGADNVTWLWTINVDTPKTGPIAHWWPGKAYVTWVGIDGYYTRPNDTFSTVFGRTINQVHRITNDPILLSETAVSPKTVRFAKITDLFDGLATYRMLGLVWFDMQSDTGVLEEDWQIEGNPPAESAFRHGASNLNLVKP